MVEKGKREREKLQVRLPGLLMRLWDAPQFTITATARAYVGPIGARELLRADLIAAETYD